MQVSKTTHCGRCGHQGLKRETRKHKGFNDTVSAVYSCENPDCEKAEGILLKFEGSLDRYIKKPGDLVGSISTYKKSRLDETFEPVNS